MTCHTSRQPHALRWLPANDDSLPNMRLLSLRGTGIDGNALVCRDGCAVLKSDKKLSFTDAMSIECWVKSDADGQDDQWFLN